MTRLTPHQCAVLTAFSGVLIGRFADFHKYAEHLLGRPVYTHEFGTQEMEDRLKDASREDLMAMMPEDLIPEMVEKAR